MAEQFDEVRITLDKERTLRYDVNAMADIEEKFDAPMTQIFNREIGYRELRVLLWAGLSWEDPELTVRKAADLIRCAPGDATGEKFKYVLDHVSKAIGLAWQVSPDPTEDGEDGTKAAIGTGAGPDQSQPDRSD